MTDGHSSSSNSSSPLALQLSIQMSPQHTEESNEVAHINAPSNHVFPLSSPVDQHQSAVIGLALLSPDPLLSQNSNSNNVKITAMSSPRKRKASPDGNAVQGSLPACTTGKENCLLLEKASSSMDISDSRFSSMQLSSDDTSLEKELKEIKTKEASKSTSNSVDSLGDTSRNDEEAVDSADMRENCEKEVK